MKEGALRPGSRREWAFLAAGAAFMLIAVLVLGARYKIIPAGNGVPVVFLLDRWTGDVQRCFADVSTHGCGHI